MKISVVTSVFNDEYLIEDFIAGFDKKFNEFNISNYEFIIVDDGSGYESVTNSRKIISKYKNARLFELKRNFGQHTAIAAGLDKAKFDVIVRSNLDLQDSLDELKTMLDLSVMGNDLVIGQYKFRNDKTFVKFSAKLFYKLIHLSSGIKFEQNTASLRVLSKRYVESVKSFKGLNRLPQGIDAWLGFDPVYVTIEHRKRSFGNSSYNLKNKINLAVSAMVYFSSRPLKIVFILGLVGSIFWFIFFAIVQVLNVYWDFIPGYYSIISLVSLGCSIIILMLGIVSLYIANIFDEVKGYPLYVMKLNQVNNQIESSKNDS